ncbi:MAG: ferrous iron transport protein A [Xanthomonadales bacterium]|nr:ferrous iron transport protein A [Xanthomonadales bacterium]
MTRMAESQSITLADLRPGQAGSIEAVDTDGPGVLRLMALGLVEGALVRFKHAAIGGDPLEISVYGASISLRRDQARNFRLAGALPGE